MRNVSEYLYSLYAWLGLLMRVWFCCVNSVLCQVIGWKQHLGDELFYIYFISRGTYEIAVNSCPTHVVQWLDHLGAPPFPSNRHHRSNGDCLEGKRQNYQVCSVQYSVQQLCTVNCTHIWTDLTVLWFGFCLTGPISLCLDSFLCMYYFVPDCILHACVVL